MDRLFLQNNAHRHGDGCSAGPARRLPVADAARFPAAGDEIPTAKAREGQETRPLARPSSPAGDLAVKIALQC
jgi:hypothetical protein